MSNNAYLTNSNIPLGTEEDDGLRVGPILSSANIYSGSGSLNYYNWGRGMLTSPISTYNITPRGPSTAGNVVANASPSGASYLTLAGDNFIATNQLSIANTSFLQLDWPRALSVIVTTANLGANVIMTVFGADYYGVPMQESVTINNIGTYNMKKAFYTVTKVYYDGAAANTSVVTLQTTDTYGLPYLITSAGNIAAISWGNDSDLGTTVPLPPTVLTSGSGVFLGAGAPVTINTTAYAGKTSIVNLTYTSSSANIGTLYVDSTASDPGLYFGVQSTSATDNNSFNWSLINPSNSSGLSTKITGGDTAVVSTTAIQTNSNVFLTLQSAAANPGNYTIQNIKQGVEFYITQSVIGAGPQSVYNWVIMPENFSNGISSALVPTAGGSKVFVYSHDVLDNSVILVNYCTPSGTTGVLSVPQSQIVPGVGFFIVSSSATDASTCRWVVLQNIPNATQGTATLVAGVATVTVPSISANSIILLSYNTLNTPAPYAVAAYVNGTSFTITASANTDISTVNWTIFPDYYTPQYFIDPIGTFVPGDLTPATATTGDPRGTYTPSTPANGFNELQFTYFVTGFDNFQNQQANVSLPAGGTPTNPITATTIKAVNQFGQPQYYTGTPA